MDLRFLVPLLFALVGCRGAPRLSGEPEVRRHYQLNEDAPGVVVAEVERGTPAAVVGIRPYEILSLVNGEPVDDVAAFERVTAKGGKVRCTIRGIARQRIVKLRAP